MTSIYTGSHPHQSAHSSVVTKIRYEIQHHGFCPVQVSVVLPSHWHCSKYFMLLLLSEYRISIWKLPISVTIKLFVVHDFLLSISLHMLSDWQQQPDSVNSTSLYSFSSLGSRCLCYCSSCSTSAASAASAKVHFSILTLVGALLVYGFGATKTNS